MLKVTARIAAVFLVFLIVSTAVICSSEALRIKVANLIYSVGEGNTAISFIDADPGDLPEDMIVPGYIPDGYRLTDAYQDGPRVVSQYQDAAGNIIMIEQNVPNPQIVVSKNSCEVEIAGRKGFVTTTEGYNTVICNNDMHCYFISGTIDASELLVIAESFMN